MPSREKRRASDRFGAGSSSSTSIWSESRVVQALVELFRNGLVITRKGLLEGGHDALVPAVEHLGGFPRLRRVAQLPRQCERQQGRALDASGVIAEIQRRRRSGAPLTGPRVPNRLRYAAGREFGTWRGAIAAAGYEYVELTRLRKYSNDELLDAVRTLAREHPDMTYSELRRHPLNDTLRVRFGTLREALRRAGRADWAPRRRTVRPPETSK